MKLKYQVIVTLVVAWGPYCGCKFPPEVLGTFNRLWFAKLYKWWCEFGDSRYPREYTLEGCQR